MGAEQWAPVANWLLTQGWAGILVILMALAIYDQRREITFLRHRNSTLQDARVTDALGMTREMVEAISNARSAVQTLTEVVKERR